MSSTTKENGSASSPPLLCLGLSRTGGTSLEQALRILGYRNPFSMDRLANDHSDKCGPWLHALDVKYKGKSSLTKQQWDHLLADFDVVRGLPPAVFASELIAAYPDSKVILTSRDVDSWYKSCLATIRWRATDPVLRWLSRLDWQTSNQYQTLFQGVQNSLYLGDFDQHGKRVFTEHNKQVRSLVRKDLLLDFQVAQGWEPLCSFLGVDVPNQPFPRGNNPEQFRASARRRDMAVAKRLLRQVAVMGMGVALLATAMWWSYRKSM